METKEKVFGGTVLNGFLMLFVNIALTLGSIALFVKGIFTLGGGWLMVLAALVLFVSLFLVFAPASS